MCVCVCVCVRVCVCVCVVVMLFDATFQSVIFYLHAGCKQQ